MNNPKEDIRLTDYENHMWLDSAYDAETVMLHGIAGENGLEHVDKTRK